MYLFVDGGVGWDLYGELKFCGLGFVFCGGCVVRVGILWWIEECLMLGDG